MLPHRSALAAGLAVALLATTAHAQPEFRGEGRGPRLVGPGVEVLVPELRESRRGRIFVMRRFDLDGDGILSRREAWAANRAFRERRGADWDALADGGRRGGERVGGGEWRSRMRGYNFRQGRYGAMFTMQDVLFQTGSAELRPGAIGRLSVLADYLGANPRVRIRIDGHTDNVGADAANEVLSRNRARSVARVLAQRGVGMGRFQLVGHGESSPIASNETEGGRRLNRRVEVSLVGIRASEFN